MKNINCTNGTRQIDTYFVSRLKADGFISGNTFSGTTSELDMIITSK